MATNFPTSLDSLTNPTSTDQLTSPSHADQHANANDAIEALQAKVGVNSSAVTTSLDYKVENLLAVSQSNRNVVINGAMQVAQRGTSVTGNTGGGYLTADRWQLIISSLGTWTQSVDNDAPTGSGFRKSLKMLCTTADASPAAGDYLFLRQQLEGQNVQQFLKGTSSAKQFTLSFWVKSNVTGTYALNLQDNDNSRMVAATYTISASATWEKKTITFPADTTGAFDNNNDASLAVWFLMAVGTNFTSGTLATTWAAANDANRAAGQTNLAAATNNYWQITGVQLEPGSVATPFEFEDYGTTLAKCQRYFWSGKWHGAACADDDYSRNILGGQFPVTMRATPTISITSGQLAGHHGNAPTSFAVNADSASFEWTSTNYRSIGSAGDVTFTASIEL